jgi:hypothetical protein
VLLQSEALERASRKLRVSRLGFVTLNQDRIELNCFKSALGSASTELASHLVSGFESSSGKLSIAFMVSEEKRGPDFAFDWRAW